ncbi:MAG: TonB-dependent receptor [Opitutaceae bacterium]|nr:TonB-dependent receptor [Opitutaceae bacterium]
MVLALTHSSRVVAGTLCCAVAATAVAEGAEAEEQKRSYRLPRGEAAAVLAQFATESGRPILFMMDAVRGEQTNALAGIFAPREALDRLLAGTALVAVHDPKSGGFIVNRRGGNTSTGSEGRTGTESRSSVGDKSVEPAKVMQTSKNAVQSATTGQTGPRKGALAFLAVWIGLAQAPAQAADSIQAFGAIHGRVQNLVTGHYLNSARVSIRGTSLTALTDQFGRYRIVEVPSGQQVVEVFYTDLDLQSLRVDVPANGVVEQDVRLTSLARYGKDPSVVKLDPFLVSSDKETDGRAIALNEQRFASNIKNVLSTDSFGDVLGSNVGEFLKFIPGLTAEYSEVEIVGVSVRGLGADKTSFSSDGALMVTPGQGGASRSFNMNTLSLNNISRIEVTKVPTPASPADSIGGSVNMVSKSAFERSGAQLNFGVSLVGDTENMSWGRTPHSHGDQLTRKILPGFDFDYTMPVGPKFGLVLTGFQSNKYNEQHLSNMLHNAGGTSTGASLARPYLQQYTLQDGPRSQRRTTFSIKADWRVTPNSVLTVGAQRNRNVVYIGTQNWVMNAGTVGTSAVAGGVPLTYGENFTVGATGRGAVTMAGNASGAAYATDGANVNYRLDDGRWKAEVGVSHSVSSIWRPRNGGIPDPATGKGAFISVGASLFEPVRVAFAEASKDRPGEIKVYGNGGNAVDIYDIRNYKLDTARVEDFDNTSSATSLSASVRRRLGILPFPLSLEVGGSQRSQRSDTRRQNGTLTYNGPDGNPTTSDPAEPFAMQVYRNQDSFYGFRNVPWISGDRAFSAFLRAPQLFTQTPAQVLAQETFRLTNSEYVAETVSAGYLQGETRLFRDRLTLLAGVRFERTATEGEGSLLDPNAVFVRNSDGSFARTAGGARIRKPEAGTAGSLDELYLTRKERAFRNRRSYEDYFPSIHLTYRIKENVLVRLAYARTYGRPNFSDIVPNATFNERDLSDADRNNPEAVRGTISIRNTALRPWLGDNYDLSIEYYSQTGGIISGGVFVKEISDFFGSAVRLATAADLQQLGLDPAYVNWNLSTKFNAGNARIRGAEINLRQSLRFLGKWGSFFTCFANGTKLELEGSNQADFTSFVPETANWGISYSRRQVTLGARWNFRGLNRLGAQPAYGPDAYQYYAARTYLDLNGAYQINRRFSVNASVSNATNVPQILLRYGSATPSYARQSRTSEFAVAWALGLKGSF